MMKCKVDGVSRLSGRGTLNTMLINTGLQKTNKTFYGTKTGGGGGNN